MRRPELNHDPLPQIQGKRAKFLDFGFARDAGGLIDNSPALGPKYLQQINDRAVILYRKPQGFDCAHVGASAFGDIVTLRFQCRGCALQSGIVRNGKAPIAVQVRVSAGGEVALDDCQQPGDFLAAGCVLPNPAVFLPFS